MKKLSVILVGAGARGQIYTDNMKDERWEVVGVADPERANLEYVKNAHNIPEERCFETWEDILALPKFADVCIISTSDSLHYAPTMKAIELGYDILLEKPVAPTPEECADISNFAREKGVKILVCHVLRYTPFFLKLKEYINNGAIGKVLNIHHAECVGNVHQSHSFVRGNWGNTEKSSCMLLAKSCHDIDILQWLLDSQATKTQSFGSLSYFNEENAPEGAPDYCIEGCPHADTCYYNAVKLYYDDKENDWFRNACTMKINPSDEEVAHALRTNQYGKCVFKCDNDVVDHQVVNLEYENGATVSFNMSAFNFGNRYIRIMGTDGELYGDMKNDFIEFYDFKTQERTTCHPLQDNPYDENLRDAHQGGDTGIVNVLYDYIVNGYEGDLLSEIGISVENHLTVFAAEKSRLEGNVVDVKKYKSELLK